MDKPKCNDPVCPYWDGDVLYGLCKRFPHEEKKESRNWCGEHPQFPAYLESLEGVPLQEGKAIETGRGFVCKSCGVGFKGHSRAGYCDQCYHPKLIAR